MPVRPVRRIVEYTFCWTAVLLLCLTGCNRQSPPSTDAYWIWAGIEVPPEVQTAPLYFYQGLLSEDAQGPRFNRRGYYPYPTTSPELYLVFRLETLDPSPRFPEAIVRLCAEWEQKGNPVSGVQLDFDAPSAQLLRYSTFLQTFRERLPRRYRLSVTGLGDWLFSAEDDALTQISAATDEVVFQLYQKRRPLPDQAKYLEKLRHLTFPFKLGQLDSTPDKIALNDTPYYHGSIFFIQN
jgi:hypothetical protein